MPKFAAFVILFLLIAACAPPAPTPAATASATRSTPTAQASETAFFASVHATSTAQIATAIAQPIATARPRTPTVSPTPGYTFRYDSGVTPEQRREIENGIAMARKYLGDVYNVIVYAFSDLTCIPEEPDSTHITCPSVRGNLGIATANIIQLNLAAESWSRGSPVGRTRVVVHEYAHIVQHYSASRDAAAPLTVGLGPIWMIEGGADFLAAWVVASEGMASFATMRESRINAVRRISAPLRSIEDRAGARAAGAGSEYTLGYFGTEFLARNYGGERSILNFYRATATSRTWHEAFRETFGISREEFYERFEEYRLKNFPPS